MLVATRRETALTKLRSLNGPGKPASFIAKIEENRDWGASPGRGRIHRHSEGPEARPAQDVRPLSELVRSLEGSMRVFLCWSAVASQKIAGAMSEFLGDVIQELKPFFSTESIRKGGRWRDDIAQALSETNFGILCLTKESLDSAWILFEAGALSKNIVSGRVTALLAGIQPADVTGPLSQFQHTRADREEIFTLTTELNQLLPEGTRLPPERLQRAFDNYWPGLERKLAEALKAGEAAGVEAPKRTLEDMLSEVLELVRELKRSSETATNVNTPLSEILSQYTVPASINLDLNARNLNKLDQILNAIKNWEQRDQTLTFRDGQPAAGSAPRIESSTAVTDTESKKHRPTGGPTKTPGN